MVRPIEQPVFISGWGSFHPTSELTNAELCHRLDTSEDWIDDHVGISSRRVAGPQESAGSMGAAALEVAIASAGCGRSEIDVVVSGTSFDAYDMPSTATRIAAHLNLDAFTFNVGAACSGWLVGLELARAMIQSGQASKVAVCATEHVTPHIDPHDRATVVFFGDAAAAAIVQGSRPVAGLEMIDAEWESDNRAYDAVTLPNGGFFAMDARRTRRWVESALVETSSRVLKRNGLEGVDLRALVCHQANLRLLEWVAVELGVPERRHWHNVEWAGNTSAAGAPTSLFEGIERERDDLRDGDPMLVVTVGAGLNVAAALLRWVGP